MRARSGKTRRVAGIVALALLALSGLGVLAAASQDDLPPDARIGVPRTGDRVAYWSSTWDLGISYAWNGTAPLVDAWGGEVNARVLHLREGPDTEGNAYHFAPGNLTPLAVGWAFQPRSNGDELTVRQAVSYGAPSYAHSEWRHPCISLAGWQGLTVREIRTRSIPDLCPALGSAESPPIEVEAEDVDGRPAIRLEIRVGVLDTLVYWFAPGEPYPLAVARCETALGCKHSDAATDGAVRVSFERGAGPELPLGQAVPRTGRGEDEMGAVGPQGPRDGGLGPYPLAEALARVEQDASLVGFQAWRRGHPEAILVRAWAQLPWPADAQAPLSPRLGQRWDLTWIGADLTTRSVSTAMQGPCALPALAPAALGACVHSQEESVAVEAAYPFTIAPVGLHLRAAAEDALRGLPEGLHARHVGWRLDATGDAEIVVYVEGMDSGEGTVQPPVQTGAYRVTHSVVYDGTSGARTRVELHDVPFHNAAAPAPTEGPERPAPGLAAQGAAVAVDALVEGRGAMALVAAGLAAGVVLPRAPAFLVALYSRLTKRDVMEHPRREAILLMLRERPGMSTPEVAVALRAGEGATRHHLDVLARAGALTGLDAGGATRWFAAGSVERAQLARQAVLAEGGAQARALALIERDPGIHAAQLARELGVTRPAAHFTLRRLAGKGLVRQERDGARLRLFPAA